MGRRREALRRRGGQRDPSALVEREQQTAGGHVFELPGERAPVPGLRQFDGQTAAAPVGIGSDQASDLFQIVVVDEAALKDDACHTPSKVAYGGVWSSAEFLCGWEEADPKT